MNWKDDWKCFYNDNFDLIKDRLKILSESENKFVPNPSSVFKIFRTVSLSDIRVVIVGQSPYSSRCIITHNFFASGIPMIPSYKCRSIPKTARMIVDEIAYEFDVPPPNPYEIFYSWIKQGVFLINMSWTQGISECEFSNNHKIFWEMFTRKLVEYINYHRPDVVYCLMGKDSWTLTDILPTTRIIKVHHPVARTSKESTEGFFHSNVFVKINQMLDTLNQKSIHWHK